MTLAIETHQLVKRYGDVTAVDDLTLRVARGEIYGFLGLNGAGKTTTIRALLGMIQADEGEVIVLGQTVNPGQSRPWGQVGHMVEAPAAYPNLTVRENLEIARRLQLVKDKSRIPQMIERLGLSAYADRKAGKLSTGNTQRLGLARALLHRPELLILDEPANGLDPAGVVEIRELLSGLAHEMGITVFMSSHILTEVDRMADRIGIIHQGQLITELDAAKLADLRAKRLTIRARDITAAQNVLTQAGFSTIEQDNTLLLHDERAIKTPEQIATLLVEAGAPPVHLSMEQENLENYFLRLTGVRS